MPAFNEAKHQIRRRTTLGVVCGIMDPGTLRVAARLAGMRARLPGYADIAEGAEQIAVRRALDALAADLEVTAWHIEARGKSDGEG